MVPDFFSDHTDLKMCLHGIIFRVEIHGDVHFGVGPRKNDVFIEFDSIVLIFRIIFGQFLECLGVVSDLTSGSSGQILGPRPPVCPSH